MSGLESQEWREFVELIGTFRGDFDDESVDERSDIEAYEEEFIEEQDLASIEENVFQLYVTFNINKKDLGRTFAYFMQVSDESTVYNTFKRMLALDESKLPQKNEVLDAYILSCAKFRPEMHEDKERLAEMFEDLRSDDNESVTSTDLAEEVGAAAGVSAGDDWSTASTGSSPRTAYSSMSFNPDAHVGNSGAFSTPLKEALNHQVTGSTLVPGR